MPGLHARFGASQNAPSSPCPPQCTPTEFFPPKSPGLLDFPPHPTQLLALRALPLGSGAVRAPGPPKCPQCLAGTVATVGRPQPHRPRCHAWILLLTPKRVWGCVGGNSPVLFLWTSRKEGMGFIWRGWGLFGPVARPTRGAITADCLPVAMAMVSTQGCGAMWRLSHGHVAPPPPCPPGWHCSPPDTRVGHRGAAGDVPKERAAPHGRLGALRGVLGKIWGVWGSGGVGWWI